VRDLCDIPAYAGERMKPCHKAYEEFIEWLTAGLDLYKAWLRDEGGERAALRAKLDKTNKGGAGPPTGESPGAAVTRQHGVGGPTSPGAPPRESSRQRAEMTRDELLEKLLGVALWDEEAGEYRWQFPDEADALVREFEAGMLEWNADDCHGHYQLHEIPGVKIDAKVDAYRRGYQDCANRLALMFRARAKALREESDGD